MKNLSEKVVFITGAGSGIGTSSAYLLASNGVPRLALADINNSSLETTRASLSQTHPDVEVILIHLDVTDETCVERALHQVVARFGRIDIGINCAGIPAHAQQTHELSLDDWRRVVDVNQTGAWLVQRALIRQMLGQDPREGRGVIVNVASILGLQAPLASTCVPAYVASKHAVMAITRMDAKVYAPKGIRINAVCPGWVETPMIQDQIQAGALDDEIQRTPAGRPAHPDEIAQCILFLASPMSIYMHGAGLVVDGGYTL